MKRRLSLVQLILLTLLIFIPMIISPLLAQIPEPLPTIASGIHSRGPTATSSLSSNNAFTLLSPGDNARDVSAFPLFEWKPNPLAVKYILVISSRKQIKIKQNIPTTGTCNAHSCIVNLAAFPELKKLKPGKTYRWFVKAVLPDRKHKSQVFNFTILSGSVSTAYPTVTPYGSDPTITIIDKNNPRLPVETHNVSTVEQLRNKINETWNGSFCVKNIVINLSPTTYNINSPYGGDIIDGVNNLGKSGLPAIRCWIIINGNGATIKRNSSDPSNKFRIFTVVGTSGRLDINNVTITKGLASNVGGSGILNHFGRLIVKNSTIEDNDIDLVTSFQTLGAGIYSFGGYLTVINSTIQYNDNNAESSGGTPYGDGGGIGVISGNAINIHGNNINNNSSSRYGGGIGAPSMGAITIRGNCFVDNSDISVYTDGQNLDATDSWWGTSNGPTGGGGSGDSISAGVAYWPVLTAPPANCANSLTWWRMMATDFLLPMNPPPPTPQARLSDLYYIDRANPTGPNALCSRDMNPPNFPTNNRLVAPAVAEVWLVDTNLNPPNGNLGNFLAIRVRALAIPAKVKQNLVNYVSPQVMTLIDANYGWLYIAYGHMNNIVAPTPVVSPPNYPEISKNTNVGNSGNSGVPGEAPHLDVSVYYVSGIVPSWVLGYAVGLNDPNRPNRPNPYDDYFAIYKATGIAGNPYGLVELIDPLEVWPLLQDAVFGGRIDMVCP